MLRLREIEAVHASDLEDLRLGKARAIRQIGFEGLEALHQLLLVDLGVMRGVEQIPVRASRQMPDPQMLVGCLGTVLIALVFGCPLRIHLPLDDNHLAEVPAVDNRPLLFRELDNRRHLDLRHFLDETRYRFLMLDRHAHGRSPLFVPRDHSMSHDLRILQGSKRKEGERVKEIGWQGVGY